jgi:pimeloyl-[acyl-carrier protein] methyl ester esterase
VGGATLRVSRFPDAPAGALPAMICVPGYGATGESFARLRPLAQWFDLHLLTPPEEAKSAADPVARFGAIVAEYARRFDRPILLGTSFGGPVVIDAAARLGNEVAGLVLISTFASLPRTPLRWLVWALPLLEWIAERTRRWGVFVLAGRGLDRAAARELLREVESITRAEKHARLVAALRCDLDAAAQRIRVPVLIIHGTRDLIVPLHNGRRLAKLIPHAEVHELRGAGHVPYLTHAGEVTAILQRRLPFASATTDGSDARGATRRW